MHRICMHYLCFTCVAKCSKWYIQWVLEFDTLLCNSHETIISTKRFIWFLHILQDTFSIYIAYYCLQICGFDLIYLFSLFVEQCTLYLCQCSYFITCLVFSVLDLPTASGTLNTAAKAKPAVAAGAEGGVSDADADLEARLNNLKRS